MDATDILLDDKVGSKLDFFDAGSEERSGRHVIWLPLFILFETARLSRGQFALLSLALSDALGLLRFRARGSLLLSCRNVIHCVGGVGSGSTSAVRILLSGHKTKNSR